MRPLRKLDADHNFPFISSSGRLALDIRRIYCDLTEFDRLYLEHTSQSFQHAVSLYKGSLLFETAYDWAIGHEAYYDIRYMEMLDYLCEFYSDRDPLLSLTYQKKREELY